MKTLFLSSIITFCVFLSMLSKRHRRINEKYKQDFWDREARANSTRKKPLNNLNYIQIPFEDLPCEVLPDHEKIKECLYLLHNLAEQKIVNFTGYTNTDLKLEYGTANITLLSEYDNNYTLLVRTLQEWAEVLFLEGYTAECKKILEFAISTDTDVSHTYYLLADLYDEEGNSEKKEALIERAANLNSALSSSIVHTLQEEGPYSDWLHSS